MAAAAPPAAQPRGVDALPAPSALRSDAPLSRAWPRVGATQTAKCCGGDRMLLKAPGRHETEQIAEGKL